MIEGEWEEREPSDLIRKYIKLPVAMAINEPIKGTKLTKY